MRIIPDSKSLESISSSSESEREFTIGRDEERQQLDTTRHHKVHSHANQKRKLPSNNPEQQKQISEFPATFSPLFRQVTRSFFASNFRRIEREIYSKLNYLQQFISEF